MARPEHFTRAGKSAAELASQTYPEFLGRMCNFFFFSCLGNLSEANFVRRTVALECLVMMNARFGGIFQSVVKIYGCSKPRQILEECLLDSYEENKARALKVLVHFPPQDSSEGGTKLWDTAMTLLKSQKPPDSLSASYIMKYLLQTSHPALGTALLQTESDKAQTKEHVQHQLSNFLVELLVDQMALARKDLCRASREGPMYKVLVCLKAGKFSETRLLTFLEAQVFLQECHSTVGRSVGIFARKTSKTPAICFNVGVYFQS